MKKTQLILLQAIVSMTPIFYYLSIWKQLPESVPVHYDSSFQADSYGSKSDMLLLLLFMFAITVGVSLLTLNLNKFDPKKRYENNLSLIIKISWVIVVFMTLLSGYIVYSTQNFSTNSSAHFTPNYIVSIVALLFTFLGNYMNNIKPNYFIGFRTPWNLEDEDNWRQTHHLASKMWFFGGLLMFLLSITLPINFVLFTMIGLLIPLVVIPLYYSYSLFRQKQKS